MTVFNIQRYGRNSGKSTILFRICFHLDVGLGFSRYLRIRKWRECIQRSDTRFTNSPSRKNKDERANKDVKTCTDDPKAFMINMLDKLQKSRTTRLDFPCLFDDSNVQSVYGMLDPTNKGHITFQQYKEAMATLGITGYDETPMGGDLDQVSFETFLREAKLGLNKASATFYSESSSSSLH